MTIGHNITGRWQPTLSHDAAHRLGVSPESYLQLRQMIDEAIANEREACAKVAETALEPYALDDDAFKGARLIAEAIRNQ